MSIVCTTVVVDKNCSLLQNNNWNQFFLNLLLSPFQGDHCPFRHEASALGCETMCSFWQQGKCHNERCNLRHMNLKVYLENKSHFELFFIQNLHFVNFCQLNCRRTENPSLATGRTSLAVVESPTAHSCTRNHTSQAIRFTLSRAQLNWRQSLLIKSGWIAKVREKRPTVTTN